MSSLVANSVTTLSGIGAKPWEMVMQGANIARATLHGASGPFERTDSAHDLPDTAATGSPYAGNPLCHVSPCATNPPCVHIPIACNPWCM